MPTVLLNPALPMIPIPSQARSPQPCLPPLQPQGVSLAIWDAIMSRPEQVHAERRILNSPACGKYLLHPAPTPASGQRPWPSRSR